MINFDFPFAKAITEPLHSDVNKTKILKTKTKTTGSKQRHLADVTFKQVNASVDLHSSGVPSAE